MKVEMYLLGYLAVSVSVASLEDGLPELSEVGAVVVLHKRTTQMTTARKQECDANCAKII